jgi:hypothetical protein
MKPKGSTAIRNYGALAFLCFILPPSSFILAGTVRTLDGRALDGDVRFDVSGQVVVKTPDGKTESVDLPDVLYANFRNDLPKALSTAGAPKAAADGQLPPPWQAIDVGKLAARGYAKFTNAGELFSIKSAGGKLGGEKDAICFVAQSVRDDADLVAKFVDSSDPERVAQGLMFRAGPEPDAAYAGVVVKGASIRFVRRARPGREAEISDAGERTLYPVWLRLTRRAPVARSPSRPARPTRARIGDS